MTKYIPVRVETISSEESLTNGMGLVPGPSLGNISSASGTIKVPVPSSPPKRVDVSRAVPGWKISAGPDPLVAERHSYHNGGVGGASPLVSQPEPSIRLSDLIGTIEVRLTSDDTEISQFEKADWVPEVIRDFGVFVVGTGKIKNSKCGRFKPLVNDSAGACQNNPTGHKPLVLPIGCTRRECPEDFRRWSHKEARRIGNAVNGLLSVKFKSQADLIPGFVPRYLPDHISIHPPRSLVVELVRRTKRDLQKALAKGENDQYSPQEVFHRIFKKKYEYEEAKALQVLGLKAAVSVYHPIRLKSDAADYQADLMKDSGRYRAVLDKDTWLKHVKFSVHSHIITDGSFLMDYNEFIKSSGGWTYRNHREISDVENLAKYLLSHAGAVPGKHSVRYLGDYQKLNIEGTIKVETFIACPECIKEGMRPEYCTYVVGELLDIEYERDKNHRLQMKSWEWGKIYGKHFIKRARIIPIFRMNPAGLPRHTLPKKNLEKHKGYIVDPLPGCGPWSGIPRQDVTLHTLEKLNGKPLTLPKDAWEKLEGYLVDPLPGCGRWSGIHKQDVCRWISHYSPDEWIEIADDDKPRWWV